MKTEDPRADDMSMRDLVAMHALAAAIGTLTSREALLGIKTVAEARSVSLQKQMADMAYAYADAMLEARKVQP